MATPPLNEDLGLAERVEDLAVERLVAEARVKALAVAVLSWRAGLDVGGPGAYGVDPGADFQGSELGTIVGSYDLRRSSQDEDVGHASISAESHPAPG